MQFNPFGNEKTSTDTFAFASTLPPGGEDDAVEGDWDDEDDEDFDDRAEDEDDLHEIALADNDEPDADEDDHLPDDDLQ